MEIDKLSLPTPDNIVETEDVINYYVRNVFQLLGQVDVSQDFPDYGKWTHKTRLPI